DLRNNMVAYREQGLTAFRRQRKHPVSVYQKTVITRRIDRIARRGSLGIWLATLVACQLMVGNCSADSDPRMIYLSGAVVGSDPGFKGVEKKAVEMLVEEVARRAGLRWNTVPSWPKDRKAVVMVGRAGAMRNLAGPFAGSLATPPTELKPEGFQIRAEEN